MPEMLDRPPAFAAEENCWLPRDHRSPGIARRLLVALLSEVEDGHRFMDVGLLLVSELVTNAVVHGTPRDNLVFLSLAVDQSRLRIDVHDARGDRSPVLRVASADDESGRGLALVKSLSQKWGCCPRANVGKIVWCEVSPENEASAVAS
ncbi:anti-sigma regulatory factor (Ser/Thr protein kinase) [Kitasatospora sp. MAA4]|uniref:ATP-binding protein n=1 Tax=Kitasatospora sp. MAA4 TaxID=3035093 RepID=UPI0024737CA9|nr:ATP-binding protein [Kitasatospora sp. MAA4]MDH6137156.1 anti-sigma regulatory factor (Ser/Thr protein kinase) [Kitasatospora sp. MAA4]